ncbi:MAG: radical SAM protein [Deltaproteobacteria bacterium]|nr:radical SAM protein [Deltaproteobacteria bacterium]
MKRALLVQLPVPGYLWPTLDANVPLAAGCLSSWAAGPGRASGWEVELLPWREADLLGDEALLRAILGRQPDLVGFSLYLWNSERSLDVARKVSEAGPAVALGGPEVLPENEWLWNAAGFAVRLPGEGEEAFAAVLRSCGERARRTDPIDLRALPSPYLSGLLPPYPDGSIWLETVRGCPFRCAYCHYGKRYARTRSFASGWLEAHLAWARERGVREVYLMDPSFNVRADWEEVLRALEAGNPEGRLALHTELVADRLGPGDGRRLARAGLKNCEVGLQTIHDSVLAAVGRTWERKAWLEGVRELTGAGIKVIVGLIAGLPGDTLAGFGESLDFVLREAPEAEVQLFPLALLPGTRLRADAGKLGLLALERPPYTVQQTPGLTFEELAACTDLFEEATGLELDPLGPPALGGFEGAARLGEVSGYVSGLLLEAATAPGDWVERVAARAAQSFVLWLKGWREGFPEEIGRFLRRLRHGVLTIVLEGAEAWPAERARALLSATGPSGHYLDRSFAFLYGRGARLVPRLVALVRESSGPASDRLGGAGRLADVAWWVRPEGPWIQEVRGHVERGDFAVVPGGPEEELKALSELLGEDARSVLFGRPEVQARWDALTGGEAFRAEHRWARLP